MRYRVVFSRGAEDDLSALFAYVAEHSGIERARAVTGQLRDYCGGFDQFPRRGRRRDDIRPGLRLVGFRRRATIAFTVDGEQVVILGIFYAGRHAEMLLRQRASSVERG
jgi:plasmid stabilization system protein ParE